ncbi:MAG TPA: Hsp20/alpha crystallin family protein [Clostridia bacterium]|nr:Hsp20/alpha crystallin family protein [Clostridia bacterium]
MSIMRWHPWRELSVIRDEVNRLFEELGRFPKETAFTAGMPAVDLWETDKDVMVTAELPGVDPDNVEINVTENTISISGETKIEEEVKERNFIRKERSYGKFSRSLSLPVPVKPDEAEASFKDGILEIRLPKAQQARVRSIKVKRK